MLCCFACVFLYLGANRRQYFELNSRLLFCSSGICCWHLGTVCSSLFLSERVAFHLFFLRKWMVFRSWSFNYSICKTASSLVWKPFDSGIYIDRISSATKTQWNTLSFGFSIGFIFFFLSTLFFSIHSHHAHWILLPFAGDKLNSQANDIEEYPFRQKKKRSWEFVVFFSLVGWDQLNKLMASFILVTEWIYLRITAEKKTHRHWHEVHVRHLNSLACVFIARRCYAGRRVDVFFQNVFSLNFLRIWGDAIVCMNRPCG